MDIETSEQLAFIPEQVESILMTVVDGILRTEVYLEEKVRGNACANSAFDPRFKLKHFGIRDLRLFVALAQSWGTRHQLAYVLGAPPTVVTVAVTLWRAPATSMALKLVNCE